MLFKMQRVCADYKTTSKKGKYNPAINCKTKQCFCFKVNMYTFQYQNREEIRGEV